MGIDHKEHAKQTPKPYTGMVTRPFTSKAEGQRCSVVEAASLLELPPLLERYGEWAICHDGLHSLWFRYFIDKNRLNESDWVEHVSAKDGVEGKDFADAFHKAREIFGYIV